MVGRLASAFEANDIDGIVALLADDVRLAMPPLPLEYVGRGRGPTLLRRRLRASGPTPPGQTRANGQPALAFYSQDVEGGEFVATSLTVVTIAGDRFVALDRFDASMLGPFGLLRSSPTNARATRPAEPSRPGPTGPAARRSRSPRR